MKTNFFAICTVLLFAYSAMGQVESQISPSDESIVVPGEIAPATDGSEGMMIESGMPLPMAASSIGSVGCCQVIPVDCCQNTIMPVVYQQQVNSSPIPSTPTTPSPISSSIGSSSVLQTPITPTTTTPAPIPAKLAFYSAKLLWFWADHRKSGFDPNDYFANKSHHHSSHFGSSKHSHGG